MSFHSTLHGRGWGGGGAHTFIADGGDLQIFAESLSKVYRSSLHTRFCAIHSVQQAHVIYQA